MHNIMRAYGYATYQEDDEYNDEEISIAAYEYDIYPEEDDGTELKDYFQL